ncbi:hypothetical protein [Oleispirillum naphthae]|uniref:hypothetical protein n=1 Tax=Oleispirillum naphthae TaxID=2838853 RepID=UPI0030822D0B
MTDTIKQTTIEAILEVAAEEGVPDSTVLPIWTALPILPAGCSGPDYPRLTIGDLRAAADVIEDLRGEMKDIAIAVGRSQTDGENDCDWHNLSGDVRAAVARAERAEKDESDLRYAVRVLERDHASDIARLQHEIEGWQAERNIARQDQEAAEDEASALRARVAALEAALAEDDAALIEARDTLCDVPPEDDDVYWEWFNRYEDTVFTRLAGKTVADVTAAPSIPPTSVSQAAADVIAAVRKLGTKEPGWKPGDDDERMGEGEGELGLAAALYLLPYEATVDGEKLLKQDDYIRLDMILELTCGWSLKPIPDRRERLVMGVALGLAEIERLDRASTGSGEG